MWSRWETDDRAQFVYDTWVHHASPA
jgi:hypothetical protein